MTIRQKLGSLRNGGRLDPWNRRPIILAEMDHLPMDEYDILSTTRYLRFTALLTCNHQGR
jgi:hypothetical protein